ncbi:MAG: hypothetical protein U1G07_03980 [Verrucomicrobiota bacterium]
MRNYLTSLLWYEDKLSSLSSRWLFAIILLCGFALASLGVGLRQFLDDLAYLLSENDLTMAAIVLAALVVSSAVLWVLSCCVGALARRAVLYLRGL